MPDPEPSKETQAERSSWAIAMSVGWELLAFALLGFGAGYWIDERWKSSPWGVLVGTLFGIGGSLYRLVRVISRLEDGGPGRR